VFVDQDERYIRKHSQLVSSDNFIDMPNDVVQYESDNIPPMHSGKVWYVRKWCQSNRLHNMRAILKYLRLVRCRWNNIITAEFEFVVEKYREDLGEWRVVF